MTGNRESAGAENDDDYNVTYYERDNVILKNVERTDRIYDFEWMDNLDIRIYDFEWMDG